MIFEYDVSVYDPEILVFVYETGADRRNILRKKGCSLKGKPSKNHKLLCQGRHIPVITVISAKGLLDYKIFHESVHGDKFYNYAFTHLVAFLQPFDRHNINTV